MSCRICKGAGVIFKNGQYLECQACKMRLSNVPKILGIGNLPQNAKKVVGNGCQVVGKSSGNQVTDLKMQVVERVLFLHNEGELSWREIGSKIGKNHSTIIKWSKGEELAKNPKILLKNLEKLKEVEIDGEDK